MYNRVSILVTCGYQFGTLKYLNIHVPRYFGKCNSAVPLRLCTLTVLKCMECYNKGMYKYPSANKADAVANALHMQMQLQMQMQMQVQVQMQM